MTSYIRIMGGIFSKRRSTTCTNDTAAPYYAFNDTQIYTDLPLGGTTVLAEITDIKERLRELDRKLELNRFENSNMIKGLVDLIENVVDNKVQTGVDSITMSRLLEEFNTLKHGRQSAA